MSSNETKQTKFADNVSSIMSTFSSATILSILGFAIGIGILLFDYFKFNDDENLFVSTSEFRVWLLSITAQTVFWTVALLYLWPALRNLKEHAKKHIPEIIIWAVLFAVLIYTSTYFAFNCPNYNLRNHGLKTGLLTYIGGAVAVMAGIGNVLVNIGLRDLLTNKLQQENLDRNIEIQKSCIRDYLDLRGALLQFLSLLGIMLGLVILAQSAKRSAIIIGDKCFDDSILPKVPVAKAFTQEKVLILGLYYTVILILTFLPTFFILVMARRKLQNEILPVPSPNSDDWDKWCGKREKLERVLAFTMTDSLRATVAILAPLIGSLLPLAISLIQFLSKKQSP
jgi:hypothetical protein